MRQGYLHLCNADCGADKCRKMFCCGKVMVDEEIERRDGGYFQLFNFSFKASGRSESNIAESTS